MSDASPPLFESPGFYARELDAAEAPALQALFDENPEYFIAVNGRGPAADEAQRELEALPPEHLSFRRQWFAGIFSRTHALEGVAVVVSDLLAPGVWHIGFFLIATARHGTGAAAEIYAALEAWAGHSGAKWLRLGVVQGYERAERFWSRRGFQEVRLRTGVDSQGRAKPVRILVKPIAEMGMDQYIAAVPRDEKSSPLA